MSQDEPSINRYVNRFLNILECQRERPARGLPAPDDAFRFYLRGILRRTNMRSSFNSRVAPPIVAYGASGYTRTDIEKRGLWTQLPVCVTHSSTAMGTPFLTATWSNLFLANYAVPPALLEPRLPPGLVLDRHAGHAFVSLVAFEFLDTRVRGIAWPGYRNFAELNLRFYVRDGDERGVVFVREFVPQRLVAWLARSLYNEPYVAAPLVATRDDDARGLHGMTYELRWAGRTHTISVTAEALPVRPTEDSVEHFFKEHRWGYGIARSGRTLRYEVDHPAWDVYPIRSHRIDLDWSAVYGPEWAFLADARPYSTVLAAGSAVRVLPKRRSP